MSKLGDLEKMLTRDMSSVMERSVFIHRTIDPRILLKLIAVAKAAKAFAEEPSVCVPTDQAESVFQSLNKALEALEQE